MVNCKEIEFYLSKVINVRQVGKMINWPIKVPERNDQFAVSLPLTTKLIYYAEQIIQLKANIINIGRQLLRKSNF